MKKEDEYYFSTRMNELADKFNAMSKAPVEGCCPGNQCFAVEPEAADEFNNLSQEIYAEFKGRGYGDDDWTTLMQASGAGRKMGLNP